MPDKYENFEALRRSRRQGRDYRTRSRNLQSALAIVAIHGGGIEPGTSEVAEAIADDNTSFYLFEGTQRSNNSELHITSTRFDEPTCLTLINAAEGVLTIHGEASSRETVFLGSRDIEGIARLRLTLKRYGFTAEAHEDCGLQGRDPSNICNKGRSGAGVQVELSHGLRLSLFQSLLAVGRQSPTERFAQLIAAIREGTGVRATADVPET